MLHAGRIDGVAGGEVITAIEHYVRLRHPLIEQRRVGLGGDGGHHHFRVDRRDGPARRIDLRGADSLHVVGYLSLQIGQVDAVVVHQSNVADARRPEVQRHRRAQAPGADHQRMGGQQPLLAFDAQFIEQDMARVAQQLVVGHAAIVGAK